MNPSNKKHILLFGTAYQPLIKLFMHTAYRQQELSVAIIILKNMHCRAPVAHTCNPRYSGGTDQKDHGLKPAWVQFPIPYLKKPFTENRLVEWLKV
jgi:hypothetical protein